MLTVMLILGIIVFGMAVGGVAQLITGRSVRQINWGQALAAGIVGSFLGGLLVSLLAGDGLALKPSGIIGSLCGAVLITALAQWYIGRGTSTR
jgi:uncharacterized membrane protein YeaQ/YmgE (transglycosylase-associated protein family)